MIRINVVVEGPTEVAFVRGTMTDAFLPLNIFLTPTLLGVAGHKGGTTNYARVQKDVLLRLKQDKTAHCTTMIDFYALGKGFPGVAHSSTSSTARDRVKLIENEWMKDICGLIPDYRPDLRFIPHLCLHEFEALLFSDPLLFADAAGHPELAQDLKNIREAVQSPEDINDSPDTAPSKRILNLIPGYQKVNDGTRAAQQIGLAKMQEQCPHFRDWIHQLKSITPIP